MLLASISHASPLSASFLLRQKSSHFYSHGYFPGASCLYRTNIGNGFGSLRCIAQLSELAPAASAVYGTLLLGGGLFAYTRSGSKGSFIGGVSGGILMATAYFLMQVPETRIVADALGFGSALLFSAVFGIRLAATRKLVPAGPLLGLSVCALAVFISAFLHDRI